MKMMCIYFSWEHVLWVYSQWREEAQIPIKVFMKYAVFCVKCKIGYSGKYRSPHMWTHFYMKAYISKIKLAHEQGYMCC